MYVFTGHANTITCLYTYTGSLTSFPLGITFRHITLTCWKQLYINKQKNTYVTYQKKGMFFVLLQTAVQPFVNQLCAEKAVNSFIQ